MNNLAQDPLVSIGMPVYNGESYIARALESIIAQTYPHWHLIVSDDASTDCTLEICRAYAALEPRIHIHAQSQNRGMMWNFAFVLEQAAAPYFMWGAQDDYRDPNYVGSLLAQLQKYPKAELCSARVSKVTIENRFISVHPFPELNANTVFGNVQMLLREMQAGWGYGLYRTSALQPKFERAYRTNIIWGWDLLLLLQYVVNQKIIGENATMFYQRKTGLSAKTYLPNTVKSYIWLMRRFVPTAFSILIESTLTEREKIQLIPTLLWWCEYKCLHVRRYLQGPPRQHLRAKPTRPLS